MRTKLFILLASLLSIATAQASTFTPVVICGNRDLVLDLGEGVSRAGREAQIVLKNEKIIDYMISTGAILPEEVNEKGEFIVRGSVFNGHFSVGASSIDERGFSLVKRNGGYLFESYVNHYPKLDKLANFQFNNCNSL